MTLDVVVYLIVIIIMFGFIGKIFKIKFDKKLKLVVFFFLFIIKKFIAKIIIVPVCAFFNSFFF